MTIAAAEAVQAKGIVAPEVQAIDHLGEDFFLMAALL